MSVGPFETLASLGDFLSGDVLPVVPKEMASEIRAAVKLLQDIADELDWLPALLRAECEEIVALQAEAEELTGLGIGAELRQQINAPTASISEQIELHRHISETSVGIVLKLQARIRELSASKEDSTNLRKLLDRYYETLGRHAETRLRWQSVFDGKQTPPQDKAAQ